MTMHHYDGFDWVDAGDDGADANHLRGKGWVIADEVSGGFTVEAQDGTLMWGSDSGYSPIGRALKVTSSNPATQVMAHASKAWPDIAVGFNLMFTDYIPTQGYKLLEIKQFSAGQNNPLYTLAIENGRLRSYAYGEYGVDAIADPALWHTGQLQVGQIYSIHYYARRTLRIVYIDGRMEMLKGGLSGLDATHSYAFYCPAPMFIDDVYQSYTDPSKWPYNCDTYFPYDYRENDVVTRHKVLSPQPNEELEFDGDWAVETETGLIDALTGGDSTYAKKNVVNEGEFVVGLEDMTWPEPPLYAWHLQGIARCNRQGSLPSEVYYIEGQLPGIEDTRTLNSGQEFALEKYWHLDTVVIGNDLRFPARDFRTEIVRNNRMSHNRATTKLQANLNQITWRLWDKEKPFIYRMGS